MNRQIFPFLTLPFYTALQSIIFCKILERVFSQEQLQKARCLCAQYNKRSLLIVPCRQSLIDGTFARCLCAQYNKRSLLIVPQNSPARLLEFPQAPDCPPARAVEHTFLRGFSLPSVTFICTSAQVRGSAFCAVRRFLNLSLFRLL